MLARLFLDTYQIWVPVCGGSVTFHSTYSTLYWLVVLVVHLRTYSTLNLIMNLSILKYHHLPIANTTQRSKKLHHLMNIITCSRPSPQATHTSIHVAFLFSWWRFRYIIHYIASPQTTDTSSIHVTFLSNWQFRYVIWYVALSTALCTCHLRDSFPAWTFTVNFPLPTPTTGQLSRAIHATKHEHRKQQL
jgi:hypothetical protein